MKNGMKEHEWAIGDFSCRNVGQEGWSCYQVSLSGKPITTYIGSKESNAFRDILLALRAAGTPHNAPESPSLRDAASGPIEEGREAGKEKVRMIQIGMRVKCKATGFCGVVTGKAEMLQGAIQWSVRPECRDNKIEDGKWMDEITLVPADEPPQMAFDPIPPEKPTVQLGDEVRSVTSGFQGICVERATWPNGCVYFSVEGKVNGKGEVPIKNIHHALLRILKERKVAPLEAEKPYVERTHIGPPTRSEASDYSYRERR